MTPAEELVQVFDKFWELPSNPNMKVRDPFDAEYSVYLMTRYGGFKFGSGPTITEWYKSDEEKTQEKIKKEMQERVKFCCGVCGVYLEDNERFSKKLCDVCWWNEWSK